MPRYIDADELIEDIKIERTNLYMEGLRGTPRSYEYLNQLQNKLEDAETVDAIPIEWIKEYRRGLPEDEIGYQFDYMLDNWKKENESNADN